MTQYNEVDHVDNSGDLYNAQWLSKGYIVAGKVCWNNLCEDLQQVFFNTDFKPVSIHSNSRRKWMRGVLYSTHPLM